MNLTLRQGALRAVMLSLVGCAPESATDLAGATDSVIVGANNERLVDGGVPVPSSFTPLYHAIGNLHASSGQCTASYIGRGVAMTAGHCFDAPGDDTGPVLSPGSYVDWANIAGAPAYLRAKVVRILHMRKVEGGVDYAFFEVFPPPDQVMATVTGAGRSASGAGTVSLLGHPLGRPLTWSGTCAQVIPFGVTFDYQCDTEHGDSGAAVLDTGNRAIGIHTWSDDISMNRGVFLGSTPAASVLSAQGAWSAGVVVRAATVSHTCSGVTTADNAFGAISQQCNGRQSCAPRVDVPSGCSQSGSITWRCGENGADQFRGWSTPAGAAGAAITLSCPGSGVSVEPPDWAGFVSDETPSMATTCATPATGLGCRGRYCDDVSLACPVVPPVAATDAGWWTPTFSEENGPMQCRADEYVTAARCSGSYCDNVAIHCNRGSRPWGSCAWTTPVSEEQGSRECPTGAALAGMQCSGRYCDNVSLFCCTPR